MENKDSFRYGGKVRIIKSGKTGIIKEFRPINFFKSFVIREDALRLEPFDSSIAWKDKIECAIDIDNTGDIEHCLLSAVEKI